MIANKLFCTLILLIMLENLVELLLNAKPFEANVSGTQMQHEKVEFLNTLFAKINDVNIYARFCSRP